MQKKYKKKRYKVVIMAGGTGGHIFPALAVADALKRKNIDIHWIGVAGSMEAKLVPKHGYDISFIQVSGLRGKNIKSILLGVFRIFMALFQTLKILRREVPELVLGMGGYVAGPGGVAAFLYKTPLVIHEQNAVLGTTNKYLARVASKVLQAFPNTFAPKYHAQTVGNPVRKEIQPKLFRSRQTGLLQVLVLGGSLGARAINQVVPPMLKLCLEEIKVWHQTGGTDFERVLSLYNKEGLKVKVSSFIDQMEIAYEWADLVICRAGALTISELAIAGKPSILIPFPYAIGNHQAINARTLADIGAAILMEEHVLTADKIATILHQLVSEPAALRRMATLAKRRARPNALRNITQVCMEFLGG